MRTRIGNFMQSSFVNFRFFFLLLLGLLFLSGCDKCESTCPRCIAADDFGIPKGSVSAVIDSNSKLLKSKAAESGEEINTSGKQLFRWQNSGYVTSGEPINLTVSGKWLFIPTRTVLGVSREEMERTFRCGDFDDAFKDLDPSLKGILPVQLCTYRNVQFREVMTGCIVKGVKIDPKFSESGCILEKGYGLYLLLRRPGDPDPNLSFSSIENPSSPTMHLQHFGDDMTIDSIFTSDCSSLKIGRDWQIYYKILDQFYQNNLGGYSLEFRTGVIDAAQRSKFFESIRSTLQTLLNGQNEAIYRAITSNNNYISLVKALIVLMIVITGLRFLLGMSEQPPSELLIKVLKMAIILQLISPSSWDFFYDNLFSLFVDGLNEVIAVVNSHTGAGYDPKQPFAFLDDTVNMLFKVLVSTKVRAILLAYPLGIFWWIILFFILIIYVILVAYAFVVYMTALIGISLLIVLMPILFLGLLFGQLKHTFDNWFTQALSFCFQAIMIFTVVSLFSSMIRDQFYKNTGYTVCCNKFWLFPLGNDVYAWTPGQRFSPFHLTNMVSKKRITFTGGSKVISIPPHYKERGCRFVDYPFYDPQISDDQCGLPGALGKGPDWERTKAISASDGGLLDIAEVFILLLLSLIMFHMRDLCQSIGAALVGASPFQAVIGGAYAAQDGIGGLYRYGKMIVGAVAEKLPLIGRMRTGIDDLSSLGDKIGEKFAAKMNETKLSGKTMKVLSTVGDISSGIIKGGSYLAGINSDLSDHYYEKKIFRRIHYVQGMMGYHFASMLGTRDLSDVPGIKMLFGGLKHVSDKYFLRRKEESLFGGLKKLYVCEREKIHDYYLGVKKEGLLDHVDKEAINAKEKVHFIGCTDQVSKDKDSDSGSTSSPPRNDLFEEKDERDITDVYGRENIDAADHNHDAASAESSSTEGVSVNNILYESTDSISEGIQEQGHYRPTGIGEGVRYVLVESRDSEDSALITREDSVVGDEERVSSEIGASSGENLSLKEIDSGTSSKNTVVETSDDAHTTSASSDSTTNKASSLLSYGRGVLSPMVSDTVTPLPTSSIVPEERDASVKNKKGSSKKQKKRKELGEGSSSPNLDVEGE